MQKQTLQFPSIESLAAFARQVSAGYLINTNKLTLTGGFRDADIELAQQRFSAALVETNEKTYQY
jgi:hypothetical protein